MPKTVKDLILTGGMISSKVKYVVYVASSLGRVLPLATVLVTSVVQLNAQPYLFSSTYADVNTPRIANLIRIDLQSGQSEVILSYDGPVLQLFPNSDQTVLFVQSRGDLDAVDVATKQTTTVMENIVWVHRILDAPRSNRVYVSVGSEEEYDSTVVLDRSTYEPLAVLRKFDSYYPPFLSKDETKYFKLIPDTAAILFDVYSTQTGELLAANRRCGQSGGFAFETTLADGRTGFGTVAIDTVPEDPDYRGQKYVVCDPDQGFVLSDIVFPWRSAAHLSGDGTYLVVEQVNFDPESPTGESHPGIVYIFSTRQGTLMQRLVLPPGGTMMVFDNYPRSVYYINDQSQQSTLTDLTVVSPATVLIDTLIAMKHQAVDLGWLRSRRDDDSDEDEQPDVGIVKNLDNRLEKAKRELMKGDSAKSRSELEKFVAKLDRLRKRSEMAEKRNRSDAAVLSEEGYLLLKTNAGYIIDRLPEREKPEKGRDKGKPNKKDQD